ncbi:MAG TPA: hypothetical protein DCE08_06360 [Ruminococcaceae bacterium]|nr:hypothetical protein [Oscillospiraceae bacterium]
MKKVLAMILCLTLVLTAASVMAFGADDVTVLGATVEDPGEDGQGTPSFMHDGDFGNAYVYGWNGLEVVRGAVIELEKASTLHDCYVTWGHPSWSTYDMSAVDYTISVSEDGEEYTEVYKATGVEGRGKGKQRTDIVVFDAPLENVKFVKLTVTKAAGNYLAISEVRFNQENTSATTSSEETSSAAASFEETSSVEETSSEAAASEATSSAAASSVTTSSEAVSSVAESSAAATDNEPKSMTWLWIVLAAVVVVVVVVIVLTSKKKK